MTGLIERGFKIFPLIPGKKAPFRGTRGCKDASALWSIDDLQSKWPNSNIGIACGKASDIIVIDVDVKGGAGGADSLVELWTRAGA